MSKSLFYRLFGAGRIPDEQLRLLQGEGEVIREEGLRASITYRHYRAAGKRCNWKRKWFVGSVMLTRKRVVAFAGRARVMNVEFDDPRIETMGFDMERAGRLLVSFDASAFNEGHSGTIELRYSTPEAERIVERILEFIDQRRS